MKTPRSSAGLPVHDAQGYEEKGDVHFPWSVLKDTNFLKSTCKSDLQVSGVRTISFRYIVLRFSLHMPYPIILR